MKFKITPLLLLLLLLMSCDGNHKLFKLIEQENYVKIVEHLEVTEDVNLTNKNGESPLTIAIKKKDIRLLKILLNNDAIFSKDNSTQALSLAINNNDISLFKLLVNTEVDLANENGQKAIKFAISENNPELLELLIKNKVDITNGNFYDYSFEKESYKCAVILYKNGLRGSQNKDIVELAFTLDSTELLKALDLSFTVDWVINNEIGYFEESLYEGVDSLDPNSQDYLGYTKLMYAAINDSVEIGKLLLEKGANPNIFNINGKRAIDYAKSTNFKLILEESDHDIKELIIGKWIYTTDTSYTFKFNNDNTCNFEDVRGFNIESTYTIEANTINLSCVRSDIYGIQEFDVAFEIIYVDSNSLELLWTFDEFGDAFYGEGTLKYIKDN